MSIRGESEIMVNFRWLTPLLLMIALSVLGFIFTELRGIRKEVEESKKFSMQYTDTMIRMIVDLGQKKK